MKTVLTFVLARRPRAGKRQHVVSSLQGDGFQRLRTSSQTYDIDPLAEAGLVPARTSFSSPRRLTSGLVHSLRPMISFFIRALVEKDSAKDYSTMLSTFVVKRISTPSTCGPLAN